MRRRILILGSSFAGLTAGLEIRRRLDRRHDVVVVAREDEFVFTPSLVWVPFGLRRKEEIAFALPSLWSDHGVRFVHASAKTIDLERRVVTTSAGDETYDHLVIATGPRPDLAAVPGFEHTLPVHDWQSAVRMGNAFDALVAHPGPIVTGAAAGAEMIGPMYELALNFAHQLSARGVDRRRAPITLVTPEPWPGHLGLGGRRPALEKLLENNGIAVETNARITSISSDSVQLEGGRSIPQKLAVITPSFVGVDAVRACTSIVDERGFVRVGDDYATLVRPEVLAAGSAVSLPPRDPSTKVPVGAPKTGALAESMARVVAENVVASIEGRARAQASLSEMQLEWVLDAGNDGVILAREPFSAGNGAESLSTGAAAHWAKTARERWFVGTRRRGIV